MTQFKLKGNNAIYLGLLGLAIVTFTYAKYVTMLGWILYAVLYALIIYGVSSKRE